MSPAWFIVGLSATAIAGGFAIGSGVDTANRSSAFSWCRSPSPPSSNNCAELATNGQAAQLRTNVLIGVTAGLGALTVLTLPFVRWHGVKASVSGGGLAFDATF